MIELTYDEVIHAIGAQLVGRSPGPASLFPGISIDSRTIHPEEAFVAIRGEHHDGHRFVEDALRKGVSTLVVSTLPDRREASKACTFLCVRDTKAALQNLAHFCRMSWGKPTLAITGSMGKTTTRMFTATVLSQHFNVHQSPSNFNNDIGLPLSLLGLEAEHDMAVLELGMNHPGELKLLGKICLPDAAVITNVAPVHLEFFPDINEIARAKQEILETVVEGGSFFWNADDPRVSEMARAYAGDKVSFGFHDSADFQITYFDLRSLYEMEFEIRTPERYFRATVPFVGKHLLYNIAVSVAVAAVNDLNWQEIDAGLSLLRTLPKRGQVYKLESVTVWDESYNSNPVAARCLLDTLASLTGSGRVILVLGDMLELGAESPSLHFELGRHVSRLNPSFLVTVGEQSRQIRAGAVDNGMSAANCAHFEDSGSAADFTLEILQPEDLLVCKGSRGVHLDHIVDSIRRARA